MKLRLWGYEIYSNASLFFFFFFFSQFLFFFLFLTEVTGMADLVLMMFVWDGNKDNHKRLNISGFPYGWPSYYSWFRSQRKMTCLWILIFDPPRIEWYRVIEWGSNERNTRCAKDRSFLLGAKRIWDSTSGRQTRKKNFDPRWKHTTTPSRSKRNGRRFCKRRLGRSEWNALEVFKGKKGFGFWEPMPEARVQEQEVVRPEIQLIMLKLDWLFVWLSTKQRQILETVYYD